MDKNRRNTTELHSRLRRDYFGLWIAIALIISTLGLTRYAVEVDETMPTVGEVFLREESSFDAADDQSLVLEQLLSGRGKPSGQRLLRVDALAVELVRRGAQQGDQMDVGIVPDGPADVTELPAGPG